MSPMDHAWAEEHGLVNAYLKERLPEEERAAFEAHFFACEECMAQLEMAEDFAAGMRDVAAEESARARVGVLAILAAASWRHRLAWAAVLLLLAALPLGLLMRNRDLEKRLAEARTSAPAEDPRVARLEAELQAVLQTGAKDRRHLEEELAKARAAATVKEEPRVNVPVFVLAAVRSGAEDGREPVNQIPLPASGPVLLTVELATVEARSYGASLRAGGRVVWQAGDLRPDSRDTLTMLLPASLLAPGVYELAIREGGRGAEIGVYPFRALRP